MTVSGDTGARDEWLAYVWSGVPGTALVVLSMGGAVSMRIASILFGLSFVGLNLAHSGATWVRVYLDPTGLRSARLERIAIPVVLALSAVALEAIGGAILLLGAQYYLSIHHGAMQNYGLARAVERRVGRRREGAGTRLDQAACLLPPIAALLWRARTVCAEYSAAPLTRPPRWLCEVTTAAAAASVVVFLAREWRAARRGEPIPLVGAAIVLVPALLWSVLLVGVAHPALPLYAIASGHYVQYLYFVWRFEARRSALAALPDWLRRRVTPPARLSYLAFVGAAGAAVTIALTLIAVAARAFASAAALRPADALAIPPWAAAMIGVNLAHYWLDHRVWRRPQVKERGAAPHFDDGTAAVSMRAGTR